MTISVNTQICSENTIQITDSAIDHIKMSNKIAKISLKSGGCAGIMASISLVDEESCGNAIKLVNSSEEKRVLIAISDQELEMIRGGELDYEETIVRSGFIIKVPSKQSCGCRKSFAP